MNWYKALKFASTAFMDLLTHPEEHEGSPDLKSLQMDLAEIIKRNNVTIDENDFENALSDNPFKIVYVKRNPLTQKWESGINMAGEKISICENEKNASYAFKCCIKKIRHFVPERMFECVMEPYKCYQEEDFSVPSDVY